MTKRRFQIFIISFVIMLLCIIPVEVFANQRVTLYLEGYKINDNKH